MAKIQLRQKKRFSALGSKPVKKVATSDDSAKDASTTASPEEKAEVKSIDNVDVEEKKTAEQKPAEAEATTNESPVNPAALYKQTMVPNSVRKRLRAEKRAAKGQAESTEKSATETVEVKESIEIAEPGPKRLGNLFNLEAQKEDQKEETKIDIIKPQAIGDAVRQDAPGSQTVAQTQNPHIDQLDPSSRSKNRSKDREFENLANNNIQEFSVDAFTQESERLKAEGKLDEYKRPLTAIGGGKHQITSLLRQAQDNKEQLEASYSQNRLTQKESGAKYGF